MTLIPERAVADVAPFPRRQFLAFVDRLKIQSKDYGLVPFRLLGSQRYILDEICRGLDEGITDFMVLKNRQCGCTTFFIALDIFWAFRHRGLMGAFILHKEEAKDDWRATIDQFYRDIPARVNMNGKRVRFRLPMSAHNRNILSFSNSSRFRYLVAGTGENRRGGLGRSGAANYTHMTEVAFYGNGEDIAAFQSSTSSIYPHRLNIEETTANGFNWWAEQWEAAATSVTKRRVFVGWWRDERNQWPRDHPYYQYFVPDGRITREERERMRAVQSEYGVEVTLEQLAWYRWHLSEKKQGDQSLMDQENPWTANDAFQATGARYFHSQDLTSAIRKAKETPVQFFRYRMGTRWDTIQVQTWRHRDADLRVWEHASKYGYYVVSCDPAFGSSEYADSNCIQVWRCFADGMEQVAEFNSSSLSMYQTAWVLAHLGGFYGTNESRVILEMNGPGKAVFAELQTVQRELKTMAPTADNYEIRNCLNRMHHFFYTKIDNVNQSDFVYQWVMSEQTKAMIMARFKDGFELGLIRIRSIPMAEEMRRVINDAGHISAEGNAHDDRVICGALAWEAYNRFMRTKLGNRNLTRERSAVIENNGGESSMDRVITNYLRKSNIALKDINRQSQKTD